MAYERKKEDGKKYYHIVYENGDVSDVDDDDEFADAIEAGYYEFTAVACQENTKDLEYHAL